MTVPSGERFLVFYRLQGDEKEAQAKAEDICLEQTVEIPRSQVPQGLIHDHILGRIESLTRMAQGAFEAVISFAVETVAGEFTQLLNVIFGNISIKPGIRVLKMELSQSLLKLFSGPRFGREKLRTLVGVQQRPLLMAALKPMGLNAESLAQIAYQCAAGGLDFIKDDHGLTNQGFAPFSERVSRCAEAVAEANARQGGHSIYVANITAPHEEIEIRARLAKAKGAGALMIAPGLTGYDAMKRLAEDGDIGLPLICHPSLQGSYVLHPDNGISHLLLFGQLARLGGADATIYPNFGGRFPFSREECREIILGTEMPMAQIKDIFPCPGGGMTIDRIPELLDFYGNEVIFLMGGGLFTGGKSLTDNCRYFVEQVSR
jgi:ribulose-bisphosphate carboxylase large chain